jgi:excinuclease UvrABC helicase subunit UvrB
VGPKLIAEGKLVEAQRLHQRTMYDLEMIKEMGFVAASKIIPVT